jgi:hypothetical protein
MRREVFMGKRQRRRFTEAFKQEAVRLCLRHDRSIGQVAVGTRAVWDFDSRHVFFRKIEEGSCCLESPPLYSLFLDTGEETVLVDDLGDFRLAAVSPNGKSWALQDGKTDERLMVLENFLPDSPAPVVGQAAGH